MKKLISIILCILIVASMVVFSISNAFALSATYLRGSFNGWDTSFQMMDVGNNNYQYTAVLGSGSYEYKYADADWGVWNTPSENLSLTLSKESTVVFEVNRNTNMNQVTVISGDTSYVTSSKPIENVKFTLAWYEHNNEMLCEGDSNRVRYTETEDDSCYWNLIPNEDDNSQFYIQNAKTKNYIYHAGDALYTAYKPSISTLYLWHIDLSTDYARITSCDVDCTNQSINLESQNGYAEMTYVPAFYMSSQYSTNKELMSYQYQLLPNGVKDTRGDVVVNSPTSMTSAATGKTWTKSQDTSSLPTFKATNTPLLETVYNLTADEVIMNEFESTYGTAFYTGELWKKVWTRDTAMSCEFSLADVLPEIAYHCAKEKVVGSGDQKVFEEDTGTGGSYPVSTDRIITMLSVWEIYLATGNLDVLREFYPICENTINQDLNVAFDKESGLFRGETCGTDWRDQTYPDWVSETKENGIPNIADSKAASVNIIYTGVYNIMAKAAEQLGKSSAQIEYWTTKRDELKKAISERLFRDDLGVYAAWEYPAYMGSFLPYKVDVISNGYALLFDVGTEEQLSLISENYPLVTYGAPTVYPQKQGDLQNANKIYHNRGVWPGWEAIMMLGAKKQGNNTMSEEIWNSCVRGAATSLTNKEVINFTTGEGVESNRQLWSIAGTLGGYYKVLFGMEYTEDGLSFKPYIPSWCKAPFKLNNFPYQDATLNIELTGSGDTVDSITVNGTSKSTNWRLDTGATGTYNIVINMVPSNSKQKINLDDEKNHVVCPSLPTMSLNGNKLSFAREAGLTYKIYDGKDFIPVDSFSYTIDTTKYGCYTLIATDENGIDSEPSKPIVVNPGAIKIEAEDGQYTSSKKRTKPSGYSGTGVVDDTINSTSPVSITVNIPEDGTYLLSCRYNNKGEPTSSNTCAIRSIYVDNKDVGTLLFPVMNFYYQESTRLPLDLTKGSHTITVKYDTANFYDRNMNINQNNVQYDYFTLSNASEMFAKDLYLLGDADLDADVSILDATTIQRKLANLPVEQYDELRADADENGYVDVFDAVLIQKYLAQLLKDSRIGTYVKKK